MQINMERCEHQGQQKQQQINTLMHSRLQMPIACCEHRASQQQHKMKICTELGHQKAPQSAKHYGMVDSVGGEGRYLWHYYVLQ